MALGLVLLVLSSCSDSKTNRAPLVMHYECTATGQTLDLIIEPDDPMPAVLELAEHIVRTCRANSDASDEHPVVLATIYATGSRSEKVRDHAAVTLHTNWTFRRMKLLQAGPDRFGWVHADEVDFIPTDFGVGVPHVTVSIPHATQALAPYIADALDMHEVFVGQAFQPHASSEQIQQLEDEATRRKRERVEKWILEIRHRLELEGDGRPPYPQTTPLDARIPATRNPH